MREVVWDKPSPGSWEFDATHATGPCGRFFDDMYTEPYRRGFAKGFETVGAPLATIEVATINGWHYVCPRPLGGPAEPKGPPPKLLMRALFWLMPSLRARHQTAKRVFERRPWRAAWDAWEHHGEAETARSVRGVADVDPAPLDDAALAALVEQAVAVFREICEAHFETAVFTSVTIGDFMVHAQRWAGASTNDALAAATGFSTATSKPLEMMDAMVATLRRDDALDVLDGEVAGMHDRMRERSPAAAAQLDAYLAAYGLHAVSGITIFDATLSERPDVWVATLRGRTRPQARGVSPRERAQAVAAELRERVPVEHRQAWDEIVADAQRATSARESDVGLLMRAVGLTRRILLEVGRRLVSRGLADEPESAFDLTVGEVVALLHGGGPTADEIRAHTAARKQHAELSPPRWVGPPSSGPPIACFPAPVARVTEAAMAFVSRFHEDADPVEAEGLAGHGVSPGVVEGIARVLDGPADFDRFDPGDILVTRTTAPSFNVVLAMASGVVTEVGGLICHAAIVSREFGIPGVVGCKGVFDEVPDGALIRVDGTTGRVEVLARAAEHGSKTRERERGAVAAVEPKVPALPGRIVALADADDVASFGGKGANLAKLWRGGVRVPDGVALDPDFAEGVAAHDPEHIARLEAALTRLGGPWAVRSSGVDEDGSGASFAGQFTTVLGVVDVDACVAAVAQVWRSAHGAGAMAYRRRLGLTASPRMAVVVQRLVDAEVAGVLFTGARAGDHLVEACWGLGEPLVSGQIDPDRFVLAGAGAVVSEEIANKTTELRLDADGRATSRPVARERARASCLKAEQLAALATLAARCEEVFGGPQDIEWAFAGGKLCCLQSRPITANAPLALAPRPATRSVRVASRP